MGYHGKCHKHPALAGLLQTEGVTQETADKLTSAGSKQAQPAARKHSPTAPFLVSARSNDATVEQYKVIKDG